MDGGWVVPASLLTAEEVADLLRASSIKTVARLRREGILRGVMVGRSYRYDVRDVTEALEQLRRAG